MADGPSRRLAGFTLIELLAVIAIIGILAVVAISATNGNSGSAAAQQGAIMASDIFALARSEAIKTQGSASVVVDDFPDPNNPGNYLHRLMVVDNSSVANSYIQASQWYSLPASVYYYPAKSPPPGIGSVSTISIYPNGTTFSGSPVVPSGNAFFTGQAFTYTYSFNGQLSTPGMFVVAVGHVNTAGSLPSYLENTDHGFYLHSLGRPTFFPDFNSISSESSNLTSH